MKKSLIVSFAINLALICAVFYLAAGNVSFYLDIASLLILIIPATVMLFAAFKPSEIAESFAILNDKTPVDRQKTAKAIVLFTFSQRALITVGFIGFLIGLISLLRDISDMTTVSKGLSVALLVVLYALILSAFFVQPALAFLSKRQANND